MSRTLRLVIWSVGLFIVVFIFSTLARYVIDDYYQLDGIYRSLANIAVAAIVCGIYVYLARPLLRT